MPGNVRNGIDLDQLTSAVESVKKDPTNGKLTFTVKTDWKGGFKAHHTTSSYMVGHEPGRHQKDYAVDTDEPRGNPRGYCRRTQQWAFGFEVDQ